MVEGASGGRERDAECRRTYPPPESPAGAGIP